jgi:hypothetical protein
MKWVRLILALAFFVPGFALLTVGVVIGVVLGLVFGGVPGS